MKTLKILTPIIVGILIVTIAVSLLSQITSLLPKWSSLGIKTKTYYTEIDLSSSLPLFPAGVKANEPFVIQGHLYFVDSEFLRENAVLLREGVISVEDSWLPLPFRTIYIDPVPPSVQPIELTTDSEGSFSIEITVDNLSTWGGSVHAYYRGEERITTNAYTKKPTLKTVYLYTSRTLPNTPDDLKGQKKISETWGNFSIMTKSVILISIVIFIGLLLFLLYHYRKYLIRKKPISTGPQVAIAANSITEYENTSGRINISFPHIEPPFPSVWGAGEPLAILCQLKSAIDNPLSNQPCVINSEEKTDIQATADNKGQVSLEYTFYAKGTFKVTVSFNDGGDHITGWKSIRIVDYREEVVNLLNEMITKLQIPEIEVNPKMTAREIESILKTKLGTVPEETIRNITSVFEEANYSLHPVNRHSYEKMYLAVREVMQYAKT